MSNSSTKVSQPTMPTTSTEDADAILLPTPSKTIEVKHHAPGLILWLQELVWQAYQTGEGEMGTFEEDAIETWVFHFTAKDLASQRVPSHFQRDVEEIWILCRFNDDEIDLEWEAGGF